MDNFEKRLRDDAAAIDATISPQLDARIRASLEGVRPEGQRRHPPQPARQPLFWWASSLTGVAAAAALIVAVNLRPPEPPPQPFQVLDTLPVLRGIEWHAESAVLTRPLRQEMDDLESDLKKAEQAVKQDIGQLLQEVNSST